MSRVALKLTSIFILQYSGFLILIFIIETIIAGSLFTYKDSFSEGLKGGLNKSIRNYGPETVMKSADFDAMQEHVSTIIRKLRFHIMNS